jgi:multiple sugar transport system ATP-binding protein
VKMRSEIAALHRRLGATMIYVTHDQVEAMTMADVIVVLRDGVVEQIGSPIELYVRPRNRFVACFLGAPQMNLLAADVAAAGAHRLELAVDQGRARIAADVAAADWRSGTALTAGLRPEHLSPTDAGPLAARVETSEILGAETIIHAVLQSGERLSISVRGLRRLSSGEPIRLSVNPADVHLFNQGGEALPRAAVPAPENQVFERGGSQ